MHLARFESLTSKHRSHITVEDFQKDMNGIKIWFLWWLKLEIKLDPYENRLIRGMDASFLLHVMVNDVYENTLPEKLFFYMDFLTIVL